MTCCIATDARASSTHASAECRKLEKRDASLTQVLAGVINHI